MATNVKEGTVQDDMEMTPVVSVKDRVKNLEEAHPDPTNKNPHRVKYYSFKKALASRFSGLILGPLFGLFIYHYITYLILSGPANTREIIMNANLTETVATDGETSSAPILSSETSQLVPPNTTFHMTSHIIGGSVGGTVGVLLVVGGLTSRRTRCAMLLMIPSLISKRGRAFMTSAAIGFLLSGPLETIDLNIQEMAHSITCLYEKIKKVSQQSLDEFQHLWNGLEEIFTQTNDHSILSNSNWYLLKFLVPDIDLVDFNLDKVFSQLKVNSISDIRHRLKRILKDVFGTVRTYSKYASKLLYLSIILTVLDAYYYMYYYYADDAFDNMTVDDSLRELWRSGNKEKILPLRCWELQLKYQYRTAIKLSKKEFQRILIQSISTIVFSIIAASILGFDAALTDSLQFFHDNAKFVIAHDGMETGVNFTTLPGLKTGQTIQMKSNLRGFNLTTEPCLPNPKTTDYGQTWFIVIMIILCLLSCLLDAFGSRLRARICNLVFEDRALQRAEYLYECIKAGRVARRFKFNILLCQQLDILDRKAQFCFCCPCCYSDSSIFNACSRVKISETCPGCQKSFEKDDGKVYTMIHNWEKKDVIICSECNEDVK